MSITAERLRELLEYDPETGVFRWRVRPAHKQWSVRFAGREAGNLRSDGYHQIRLGGRLWLSHQLAWLWLYGEWPSSEIDHVNGEPADNRAANLRLASRSQNMANKRRHHNSTSGMKGAFRSGAGWTAEVQKDGRRVYLGYFSTPEAAHAAYVRAAAELHGEFART